MENDIKPKPNTDPALIEILQQLTAQQVLASKQQEKTHTMLENFFNNAEAEGKIFKEMSFTIGELRNGINATFEKLNDKIDTNNFDLLTRLKASSDRIAQVSELNQYKNARDHFKRITVWGALWVMLTIHHDAIVLLILGISFNFVPFETVEKVALAWCSGIGLSLAYVMKVVITNKTTPWTGLDRRSKSENSKPSN